MGAAHLPSRMAIDEAGGRGGPRVEVIYACHGCGARFPDDAVGPGTCPRCGAIGGHERTGVRE